MVNGKAILEWLRGHWVVVGISILCLGLGHLAGYWLHPRVVVRTEEKEVVKWQTRTEMVTVEKPVDRWRTRTITKTQYVYGTTQPEATTTIVETSGSHSEGGETRTLAVTTTDRERDTKTVSTSGETEGRWSVRAMVGLSTSSGTVVGAGADYRLVGPVTVGLWTTVPLGSPSVQGGVSVGLRL